MTEPTLEEMIIAVWNHFPGAHTSNFDGKTIVADDRKIAESWQDAYSKLPKFARTRCLATMDDTLDCCAPDCPCANQAEPESEDEAFERWFTEAISREAPDNWVVSMVHKYTKHAWHARARLSAGGK